MSSGFTKTRGISKDLAGEGSSKGVVVAVGGDARNRGRYGTGNGGVPVEIFYHMRYGKIFTIGAVSYGTNEDGARALEMVDEHIHHRKWGSNSQLYDFSRTKTNIWLYDRGKSNYLCRSRQRKGQWRILICIE